MLFGAERAVYYLESPTATLEELDGSAKKGIRQSTEKFLDSPDSAFNKDILSHLQQVRHLKSNTRAFATWCQDEESNRELCVVQAIYKKGNQSAYFSHDRTYNKEGKQWKSRFSQLNDEEYQNWVEQKHKNSDVILVTTD